MKPRMERFSDTPLFLPLLGLMAGFVNGLLGAGGGVLAVMALSKKFERSESSEKSKRSEISKRPERAERNKAIGYTKADVFAMSLSAMLPVSLFSAFVYARNGALTTDGFGIFAIPAVLGGLVGGLLLDKLKPKFLSRIFTALVIYSGVMMIVK